MKLLEKKILLLILVVLYSLGYAQTNPGAPCGIDGFPPCENPTSPIDMYVYLLAVVAFAGIIYFSKKKSIQKI